MVHCHRCSPPLHAAQDEGGRTVADAACQRGCFVVSACTGSCCAYFIAVIAGWVSCMLWRVVTIAKRGVCSSWMPRPAVPIWHTSMVQ